MSKQTESRRGAAVPASALQRLSQQRLTHNPLATPGEVVAWLGAVQAQDYAGAKWALAMRMHPTTDALLDEAFDAGEILRTHVMRPTWHFVAPADIRWLLELTAPRVKAKLTYMNRRLELDEALIARSNVAIAAALRDGQPLTRAELGAALARAGIRADGLRLTHLVMYAELDAVIGSGPRRGKQFTYMLLDERAPQARTLPPDEALAELTRRYYTGHGPATLHDFAWWSGLTVADARAGLALVGTDLDHEEIEGETYWFAASLPPIPEPCQAAFLLPTYDEVLVGFAAFDLTRRAGRGVIRGNTFDPSLLIGGQVAGSWKRTFKKGAVLVEYGPFEPLASPGREALHHAARQYGSFLGLSVEETFRPSDPV